MCLITKQKEPIITTRDIIGYKVLEGNLESIFNSFEYTLNKLYKTEIRRSNDYSHATRKTGNWLLSIIGGPYSSHKESLIDLGFVSYGAGFHFCANKECLSDHLSEYLHGGEIKVKCIIPKGSEVYYDGVGNAVTNSIKVVEILK